MANGSTGMGMPQVGGMLANVNKRVTIVAVLTLHWFFFWLLNGLDKFLNTDNFFGVDFKNKLKGPDSNGLLSNLGLSNAWAAPIAVIVGIIELVLAILFLSALVQLIRRHSGSVEQISACITLSVLFFAVLSFGAILFGDRPAMEQHGVFIIALLASRMVIGKAAAKA